MKAIDLFNDAVTKMKEAFHNTHEQARAKEKEAQELQTVYELTLEKGDNVKALEIKKQIQELTAESSTLREMAETSKVGKKDAEKLAFETVDQAKANITKLQKQYNEQFNELEAIKTQLLEQVKAIYATQEKVINEYSNILSVREYTGQQDAPGFEVKPLIQDSFKKQYNDVVSDGITTAMIAINKAENNLNKLGIKYPKDDAKNNLIKFKYGGNHSIL